MKNIDIKDLRMWIDGASSAINTFMFLSPPKEKSLEDIFNTSHKELLNEVTEYFCQKPGGFGPKGFRHLVEVGFKPHQLEKMDKAIQSFALLESSDHIWSLLKTMDYNRDTDEAKKRKRNDAEVYTPVKVIDEMLDKLPETVWNNKQTTFLDPACGRGVFLLRIKERLMESLKNVIKDEDDRDRHIVENMIFGWDSRPLQVKIANKVVNFKKTFSTNIVTKDSIVSEYKGRKFDVVIGNPPYKGNMHLKFLEKADDLTTEDGKICFVHPAPWVLNRKDVRKTKVERACLAMLEEYKTDLEIINGYKEFNVRFFSPCVITNIDKSKKSKDIYVKNRVTNELHKYESVKEIRVQGNDPKFLSLMDKLSSFENKLTKLEKNKEGEYYVTLSRIRGDASKDVMFIPGYFTFIPRSAEVKEGKPKDKSFDIHFKTEKEASNCIAYLKTRFARFALSTLKINGHVDSGEMANVPLLDFTQEWDDEKLYKHFKLTDSEINIIEETIAPGYYDEN